MRSYSVLRPTTHCTTVVLRGKPFVIMMCNMLSTITLLCITAMLRKLFLAPTVSQENIKINDDGGIR